MSTRPLESERALLDANRRPQPAVLSLSQEASLLFQELAMRSGAARYGNDFAQVFRARRHLDAALLEECLRVIIARHSSLRTAFRPSGLVARPFREMDLVMFSRTRLFVPGLYTGATHPADTVGVPLSQVSSPRALTEAGLSDLIWRESSQRLTLETPPALRACLITAESAEQMLLLVMSHLVFDAWSIGLFLNELTTLYLSGAGEAPARRSVRALCTRAAPPARKWRTQSQSGILGD
jgi:hypothetical protein